MNGSRVKVNKHLENLDFFYFDFFRRTLRRNAVSTTNVGAGVNCPSCCFEETERY